MYPTERNPKAPVEFAGNGEDKSRENKIEPLRHLVMKLSLRKKTNWWDSILQIRPQDSLSLKALHKTGRKKDIW